MSATSSIEWTDRTWNPVRGCSVISPGCVNCYAMKLAHRFSGPGRAYEGLTKLTERSGPQWSGVVRTVPEALLEPLSWRKPARVFVNSMSDLFHEGVPDEFIDQVFATMAAAHRHTFQVLTKRADRMAAYLSAPDLEERIHWASLDRFGHTEDFDAQVDSWVYGRWPLPNVWLGVSVEDQAHADKRIPMLLQTPAAVRFISAEPLLGPVDLKPYIVNRTTHHLAVDVEGALANREFGWFTENGRPLTPKEAEDRLRILSFQGVKRISVAGGECVGFSDQTGCPGHRTHGVDWVIVGGESGNGARPFDIAWPRDIVSQCKSAGVPVFVKQLGADPHDRDRDYIDRGVITNRVRLNDKKGGDMAEWPADLRVRKFPR